MRAHTHQNGPQRRPGSCGRHRRRGRVHRDEQSPGHGGNRLRAGRRALRAADPGRRDPGRFRQRYPVRDASTRTHNPTYRPAIQNEHRLRARQGNERAVQGTLSVRFPQHQPHQNRVATHRNRPIRLVDDANVGTAKHFEYMFYIDFEASMAEPRAQNALAEVQEFTSFLRVLGSYPMDMTPWNPSSSRED
ncbi:UNVERIFIED_CONTAM: Arogenate dehydratase/prephenate dehydratase 6, chloroplastic [Sesamum radiatum]|uniref:Arogenate dehydratase/prephenate dehydratase 6, chloroplastic n=1 Tax=Sesamum radiatum TaxID=300843 RepID=A0AAW2W6W9_SESRA